MADCSTIILCAPKSSVTLFTSWSKQVNAQLNVDYDGMAIPMIKYPRLLGIIFDPLHTFFHHAASIARLASSRLNIMRVLADSSFGKDKECLLMTFKMFVESLFDYGAPIVYSFASIERLQKVQNKALRLALRCHAAASVDHLHAEVGELPVGFHLLLLSSQFLARSLPLASVSFPVAQLEQGRRRLKQRES